uniref:Reverse transcriptase domain-containing protein n=1 Tax=Amphimedon queenslandica TaxID=400682 RepID=A0A1X7UDK2_AMPQE
MDLKDAYFSIPIHREHQKFLNFTWRNTNNQFTWLQFGLASAPWVFTKTLRPAAARGRELWM